MKVAIRVWDEREGSVATVESIYTTYPKFAELYGKTRAKSYTKKAGTYGEHRVYFYTLTGK